MKVVNKIFIVIAFLLLGTFLLFLYERMLYPHDCKMTMRTIGRLAAEISGLRLKTGKLPADTEALVRELKHELPHDSWGAEIEYIASPPNSFRLSAMSPYPDLDIFEYDSNQWRKGVTIYSF